jgi:diguanylate cyclase (GGDEF)-like protein
MSRKIARYAREIAKSEPTLPAQLTVAQAVEVFLKNESLSAMAVIKDQQVIGLVERKTLTDLFSSRFGRELNAKKSIARFIDKQSLIVSTNTPLEMISNMITQRSANDAQGVFVVTDNGSYFGLGYFIDLLRAITEIKMMLAQEANPLTGLPGNKAIQNAMQAQIIAKQPFLALYFDLDHFKAYNDYYGYEKGDIVLGSLAQLLRHHVRDDEFLGHIGGDDFILIWKLEAWQQRLLHIFDAFNSRLADWYDAEQIAQGGFEGLDRHNKTCFFSLMSLSVGVLAVKIEQFQYEHQLAQLASKAKKKAKSLTGNSWYLMES